jgi:predicted Zn-dependent protease
MLLGDFVGGGAVILGAKAILQTSYSRQVESAADAYGVVLMNDIGADARALARILQRIAGTTHPESKLLADHPATRERVAAIEALAKSEPGKELLDASQWAALKAICSRA